MIIKAIQEDYLQNDDDFSCLTGVMGITGTLFISQDISSNLPSFFQQSTKEAATESKNKRLVAAMSHLQDYMNASNNNPINWDDLTHDDMNQYF